MGMRNTRVKALDGGYQLAAAPSAIVERFRTCLDIRRQPCTLRPTGHLGTRATQCCGPGNNGSESSVLKGSFKSASRGL
ncbi:hypothetical protein PM082_009426 [Marasmius tenuissimus]|nr:hypothetical protein PM082_009426 [Marasmius tenuissimus]